MFVDKLDIGFSHNEITWSCGAILKSNDNTQHVHVPPTKAENKAGQQSAKEVTRNLDKEKSKKKKEDSFCKLRRPIKGDGGVRVLSSVKLLF